MGGIAVLQKWQSKWDPWPAGWQYYLTQKWQSKRDAWGLAGGKAVPSVAKINEKIKIEIKNENEK